MRPPLDGSLAIVTGASSGIGLEFAKALAPRVRALVLVARRVERLEALKAELVAARPELEVHVKPCDLTDRAATARLVDEVETLGPIDILINNAGVGDMGMFEIAPWDKVVRMIELNVVATTYLFHRLGRSMAERRRGGILNVSSGFGLEWLPGFGVYGATKHYLTALTESVRLELRRHGVVVTQLCPGPVATEFEEHVGNFTGQKVPGFVEITAQHCARSGLRGFERGRAVVIPGIAINLILGLGAISPRFVKRFVYRLLAGQLEKMQMKALPPATPDSASGPR